MKRHDPQFSRPLSVADLPGQGLDIRVEASPEECAEIAREFKLLAVATLSGTYHVDAFAGGARVKGEVVARVRRTCVVSLDAFDAELREPVDLAFAAMPGQGEVSALRGGKVAISLEEEDPPEVLADGRIDLGAITLEFLALGLDPYPRKPGVEFSHAGAEGEPPPSPFAALAGFARKPSGRE
jgi:hypothetical protein